MKNYVVGFLSRAYEFVNPEYARDKRMKKFNELKNNGALERMCASQIHKIFRITKVSNEF